MARIEISGVRHSYLRAPQSDEDYALRRIDHVWETGGAYALLGPSGCGKTSLLNIMSGLVRPTEGRILFDGRDVTDLPTERRNIAQVFQFPVIYDTMTVAENLAFPLRNRGVRDAEVGRRVDEMLAILGLADRGRQRARGLSAEDKQNISLGRGLIRSDVNAILFDEPLTVIDPLMKWELRTQLRQLHQRLGHTMVYVTHDQTEALTFADQVVVMHEGMIVQVGTPADLFERPQHTFVGYFIGSPGMNVLPVRADGDGLSAGGVRLDPSPLSLSTEGRLEAGVRPEHVRLGREGAPARLLRVDDLGRRRIARLDLSGVMLLAALPEGSEIPSDPCVTFEPGMVHLYRDSWRVSGERLP